MMYFFSALFIFVIFINFKIAATILKRESLYFEKNKKKGLGEVIGYESSRGIRGHSLIVKVLDFEDEKKCVLNYPKVKIDDYPEGKIVNIDYAVTKMGFVQARLSDGPYLDKMAIAKIFNKISVILLLAAIVLSIAGISTTLL